MSVHAQFVLLALAGFVVTAPVIVVAWIYHLPDRRLASALYAVGFALIGATLIVDPIARPPLFYHGFFPGIGIGAASVAMALVAMGLRRGHSH
ncbi:MAG TPA: hypothetical protein VE338_03365 [Ktedonobacterales bacterium]|nr:hypothetical protein [Ktedonobacterales bacterium]